ncbi:MAG: hypothetical protein FRX48_03472 [Lasallia pustulata]|uniref:Uncharacterized protein n=1 Tax=Lasallia pustulata TaxID=136370 RepID=A0A5M8PUZ3_9LECA|nr:MAG: hypothetical protein FRX48_03472 [Lasallia pustulata]
MRRENILEREQAQQARAQRLQQQQERIANAAEGRLKNSLSFEDAIENLMRRNHEAERLHRGEVSENVLAATVAAAAAFTAFAEAATSGLEGGPEKGINEVRGNEGGTRMLAEFDI